MPLHFRLYPTHTKAVIDTISITTGTAATTNSGISDGGRGLKAR